MAIERQDDASGDNQYLLRVVTKAKDGSYILNANNPTYEDLPATDEMRTLARFKAVIDPFDLILGQAFAREDIPALFGESFNPGNWNVGHVVLNEKRVHVLLVTLNKPSPINPNGMYGPCHICFRPRLQDDNLSKAVRGKSTNALASGIAPPV